MNFSVLIGITLLFGALYSGLFQSFKSPQVFLDHRAFAIVILGTLAISFLAYPYAVLSKAVDYILWGFIFRRKKPYLQISKDIVAARSSYLVNQNYITTDDSHPFFRECVMFLLNKNINNAALRQILNHRLDHFKHRYHEDYHVLKSLGKYPLILGVVAAVLSLIETIQTGQNVWAGVLSALVSVLMGISVTTFFLWPVADSAYKSAQEDFTLRSLIVDGVILIRERATDEHFQAYLRGYLNINDRLELKVNQSQNVYPFAVSPKVELREEIVAEPEVSLSHAVQDNQYVDEGKTEIVKSQSSTHKARLPEHPKVEKPFENLQTLTKEKTEASGRVESSIHLDPKATAEVGQIDFKSLRTEMKKTGSRKNR